MKANLPFNRQVNLSRLLFRYKLPYKCKLFVKFWLAIAIMAIILSGHSVLAQPDQNQEHPQLQDPLIPKGYGKRELTSFEQYRITKKVEELAQTATQEIAQGNIERGMQLWYRQLKLLRVLDRGREIVALGQVGAIAWRENRRQDVRQIAQRLMNIESENDSNNKLPNQLSSKLAMAYREIRYLDKSITIYQQILLEQRKTSQVSSFQDTLVILGELYLAIFDYDNAETIYQELLANTNNPKAQEAYLITLKNIYHYNQKLELAIATRNQLIQRYTKTPKSPLIPELQLANARDREQHQQTTIAIEDYQITLKTALKHQQLEIATQALNSIARIYQQQKNWQPAINSYQQLLALQNQANNYYGLINTYDTLGKLQLRLNRKAQAQTYLQQALSLAQSLKYRVTYFQNQLEKIKQSQT